MTKDHEIGSCMEVGDCGGRLPEGTSTGSVAPFGGFVARGFRLLDAPCLAADVRDDRHGHQPVSLEPADPQPLHDRVDVLDSVAEGSGGWVDHKAVFGESGVDRQDIDLLGHVDVDRRFRDDAMSVRDPKRGQGPVILLGDRSEQTPLPGHSFRDRREDFGILLLIAASPDHQRYVHGVEYAAGCRRGLLR